LADIEKKRGKKKKSLKRKKRKGEKKDSPRFYTSRGGQGGEKEARKGRENRRLLDDFSRERGKKGGKEGEVGKGKIGGGNSEAKLPALPVVPS